MSPSTASRPLMHVARWVLAIIVVILLVPYVIAPFYRFGHPISTLMLWRWVTGARVERVWEPLSAISPTVPAAVLAAEDAHFCKHWGIDLGELRAALQDAEERGRLRGGSTVTQQVAKNLFLWQGRSIVRKALEAPLAVWIDFVLPKRRILEIYLNIAEWGPDGQFGIEAGARRAFNKSAHDLTLREAAMMAAMLPNPVERNAARPGPGLRRLAGIYQARAVTMAGLDACIRRR